MINTLTLDTLIAKGACAEAQKEFARIFPNGALLAVQTFVNVAAKFDWHCAAKLLLTPRNRVKFENTRNDGTARAAAYVTLTAARSNYNAFYAAYDTTRAAYNGYAAAYDTARNAYNTARNACAAACDAAFATAFATLYIEQEATS